MKNKKIKVITSTSTGRCAPGTTPPRASKRAAGGARRRILSEGSPRRLGELAIERSFTLIALGLVVLLASGCTVSGGAALGGKASRDPFVMPPQPVQASVTTGAAAVQPEPSTP